MESVHKHITAAVCANCKYPVSPVINPCPECGLTSIKIEFGSDEHQKLVRQVQITTMVAAPIAAVNASLLLFSFAYLFGANYPWLVGLLYLATLLSVGTLLIKSIRYLAVFKADVQYRFWLLIATQIFLAVMYASSISWAIIINDRVATLQIIVVEILASYIFVINGFEIYSYIIKKYPKDQTQRRIQSQVSSARWVSYTMVVSLGICLFSAPFSWLILVSGCAINLAICRNIFKNNKRWEHTSL